MLNWDESVVMSRIPKRSPSCKYDILSLKFSFAHLSILLLIYELTRCKIKTFPSNICGTQE